MHATDYRSLIWVLILGLAPATALARTPKKANKSTTSDSGVEAGKTPAPAGGAGERSEPVERPAASCRGADDDVSRSRQLGFLLHSRRHRSGRRRWKAARRH